MLLAKYGIYFYYSLLRVGRRINFLSIIVAFLVSEFSSLGTFKNTDYYGVCIKILNGNDVLDQP